jgi:hypothetical protein
MEFLDKAVPGRTGLKNTETLMELNILIYWFSMANVLSLNF